MLGRMLVVVLSLVTPSVVTGYDERPMNEDEFFGARMQQHNQGQGLYQEPQGRGGLALILAAIAGAGIEWFWTGRTIKRDAQRFSEFSTEFMAKWNADRDALMTRRTYPIKLLAHEVEEADMQLMQLVAAAEDAGVDVATFGTGGVGTARPAVRTAHQDSLEYEEFRQPDANGDNVISKQEFNQYIRAYLQMYPETLDRDIPRFEDFDLNRDGMVTFDEWQLYLDRHQQAEVKHESDLLRSMLETSAQSQGFNSLAQNMQRAQRAGRY